MGSLTKLSPGNDNDQPRRSSIRNLLTFRSSKQDSRKSSIDSTRSSLEIDYSADAKPRRFSKPLNASPISMVQTTSSLDSTGSGTKLRKKSTLTMESSRKPNPNDEWERDRVTGERKDPTNMLHSIAHDFDGPRTGKQVIFETDTPARPATEFVSTLAPHIWTRVISFLSLVDEASLSLSCKPFQSLCSPTTIRQLNIPTNFRARCEFMYRLTYALPNHLLCYVCGTFHLRTNPGTETLRPTNIANPIYTCPYSTVTSDDPALRVSKHRITFNRHLPYPFVQLALRHAAFGPAHGIHHDTLLGRRYKDRSAAGLTGWSHQTRYAIIESQLYVRVVSSSFVTPALPLAGKRQLLYSREDFTPFFSVCAHWRNGDLMPICRCALDHVPVPLAGSGVQRVASETMQKFQKPQGMIVTQCEVCKPLRRCPQCPTEYLVEVRLQEDGTEKELGNRFKHAICVTRWSCLGDGSAPWEKAWAACKGDLDTEGEGESNQDAEGEGQGGYDSFKELGRRAISGVFESWFNPEQVPTQRLVSLNPGGERLGEKGHNWY